MPDDPKREAESEAELAADFFLHLVHRGVEERAAREMAVAYILGRQRARAEHPPEPWDL